MSISVFKKYLQGSKASPLEKGQPRQSNLPDLPNELWFSIFEKFIQVPLEFVLYGSSFDPRQIEQAHCCLTDLRFSTKRRVQVPMRKNRDILRLVCRSWKAIVDSIKIDSGQILDHYYVSSKERLPINTNLCTRLNMVYRLGSPGERIKFGYSRPISTLSLLLESGDDSTSFLHSFADILSFPKDIQVLTLHIRGCIASKYLFNDIQTMSIPLTVLCLHVTNVDMLQIILNVSTVVTLFLSIPAYRMTRWRDCPPEYRWTFPALRNISLQENDEWSHRNSSTHIHPFFSELLTTHLDTIQALRIIPISIGMFDRGSTICWIRMPQLKSLATDFAALDRAGYTQQRQGHTPKPVISGTVCHLIQIYTSSQYIEEASRGTRACIQLCNQLESVTFPRFFMNDKLHQHPLKYAETRRLIKLCKERHIEFWEQHQDIHEKSAYSGN